MNPSTICLVTQQHYYDIIPHNNQGLCTVIGFGTSHVESSGSVTTELMMYVIMAIYL
jgi:hypothetical protein